MAMFSIQPANGAAPQGQSNPQGMFSAGNAFGQAAGDAYAKAQERLANPLNYDNAPKLPGVDDFSADRQRIEQAMLGRAKGELDTRYAQEVQDFEQQMANQGVDIGSERYKRERTQFDKGRNEAYNDAGFRAMIAGGDEQTRLFNMGLSARKQSVDEADSLRASNIADLAALLNPALKMEEIVSTRDTANLDRTSRETLARMQDETQRYGYDKSFLTGQLDRDQRTKLQDDDQDFRRKESKEDRKVQREGIRRSGGGGGGNLDVNALIALFEKLTGEKLAG